MTTRRDVLKGMAVGAAAAAVTTDVVQTLPQRMGLAEGRTPWWLLAPAGKGASLARGWYIEDLSPVRQGASVLTVAHSSGHRARLHVCLHEGNPRGMAHTALLDLVLMDGGAGDKRTNEELGRVLLGLARRIADNELDENGDLWSVAFMTTHSERLANYGPQALTDPNLMPRERPVEDSIA
jgi:hypothetical protein